MSEEHSERHVEALVESDGSIEVIDRETRFTIAAADELPSRMGAGECHVQALSLSGAKAEESVQRLATVCAKRGWALAARVRPDPTEPSPGLRDPVHLVLGSNGEIQSLHCEPGQNVAIVSQRASPEAEIRAAFALSRTGCSVTIRPVSASSPASTPALVAP